MCVSTKQLILTTFISALITEYEIPTFPRRASLNWLEFLVNPPEPTLSSAIVSNQSGISCWAYTETQKIKNEYKMLIFAVHMLQTGGMVAHLVRHWIHDQ